MVPPGTFVPLTFHSAISHLSPRNVLDARTEDRDPRIGAIGAWKLSDCIPARGYRSPLYEGHLPDHGDLLANVIRWAGKDSVPLVVEGPGLIDCALYQQPDRLILHLVNLTSAGTWCGPVEELVAVGPFKVQLRLPRQFSGRNARFLVSGESKT